MNPHCGILHLGDVSTQRWVERASAVHLGVRKRGNPKPESLRIVPPVWVISILNSVPSSQKTMSTKYQYHVLKFDFPIDRKEASESWEMFLEEDPNNNAGRISSPYEADLTIAVENYVEGFLTGAGIEFLHEYSWPDGSCYKSVRILECESISEVVRRLNELLQKFPNGLGVSVSHAGKQDAKEAHAGGEPTEKQFNSAYKDSGAKPVKADRKGYSYKQLRMWTNGDRRRIDKKNRGEEDFNPLEEFSYYKWRDSGVIEVIYHEKEHGLYALNLFSGHAHPLKSICSGGPEKFFVAKMDYETAIKNGMTVCPLAEAVLKRLACP